MPEIGPPIILTIRLTVGCSSHIMIYLDGKSNDKKVDFKIPAEEIRNMGVDIIAVGAGSVDKTQLLEITGQRSEKIYTG